ncbi:hypothetical protein [Halostagnicola sp. A-GB9-2]|uniref:hypothetical protein n=1 Tax=Halostagnicola sp. A-GB9-2 TaxID=3048066 RepID=UPI0024BF54BC|nr:hypothetical protein [Halostagnicola sp. A-GB9-2]MDJ1434430.1 hypothetical protein [Halostagnicola sp. A-GB9-2]
MIEAVRRLVSNLPDRSNSIESQVTALYDHLEATASLPIDRQANRWLGEAEAVAEDAITPGLEKRVIETRVRQVQRLLEEAETPNNEEATAHLEAAKQICDDVLDDQ